MKPAVPGSNPGIPATIKSQMFFKKKKPWYAFDPPYMKRTDQIAWLKTVQELREPDEKIPRVLPGQNMYMCLNGNCDEPTYVKFCPLCIADHECFGMPLEERREKE